MWNLFSWLVISFLVLVPFEAKAQEPPGAAGCDTTWFKKPRDQVALGPSEIKAICEASVDRFGAAMAVCAEDKDRCLAVRRAACTALTGTSIDMLAKCYRAAGDPRFPSDPEPVPNKPPEPPPPPTSVRNAQAEGLAAAGAVSIIAQGVGDFLVQRAEQEVALYAATELQRALCKKYGEAYFPKSCKLLKESDDDGEPVGLGVLRRAIVDDVRLLPANALVGVMGRLKLNDKSKACMLDVGHAFATGVLQEGTVAPLLEPNSDENGHLRLHKYRIKTWDAATKNWKSFAECDDTWNTIREAAKDLRIVVPLFKDLTKDKGLTEATNSARNVGTSRNLTSRQLALLELWGDLAGALNDILQGPAPKEASARAIRAGIALLKALLPEANRVAFDEAGAIAIAAIHGDWLGVIGAVAAADALGPVLLCRKNAESCVLDTKARATLRLVGDIAAADSSAGVTAALERFAAPLGSWRRKYNDGWYFMANGYVGGKFAGEWVKDARPAMAMAPLLAVGLEAGRNVGTHARFGFFLQAVDLGNVSSVRLTEFKREDRNLLHVEVAPDVTAVQLLAPGLFFTVAPWKAPFALSLGADWVPELRTAGGERKSAFHAGVALVVDTPLLEIAQ